MCGALEELVDKGRQEGMLKGILANIRTCKTFHISKEDTIKNIAKEFSLPEEKAVEYIEKYWQTKVLSELNVWGRIYNGSALIFVR